MTGDDVLLALTRAVVGLSTRAAGQVGGISVHQLPALTVLCEQEGTELAELARALGITVSTASRLVDRLVAAGLADRQHSPRTRREVVLQPTAAGRAVLERYDALRLTALRAALEALPAARRDTVLAALDEYGTALRTPPAPRPAEPEGGDPACWLHRVCPACGRLADEDPPTRCAACGEPLPEE
ncbi:MarR family transcriptional regulator [Geodermatophilus sp. TF02-6]|uniref:MarR family winged helix-turn-helix transcriptional regulator n=1 Tax=Geodermatophilus sp. TF02-6 TaxID=2250575 RepID=UPI000DEBC463|nr:MarR family transcriptional regulator [Geodermatophilus sp. TF02-6]RBY77614.1 MarR family transcriptional regulator [Geodermatophilus sp. TF02-6]